MLITFGTPDDKIKEATIKELIHALATPDGCGSKKKLIALQKLLSYNDFASYEVEVLLNTGEKP